jgi:hypothetical protein
MRMDEAPKYAQNAIPAVPELLMLTYSNKHKRDADGLKKFVGKSRKNPMPVYEGAVKASMEDWLYDLPKGAIRELKAKHGKHLAQTGMGGKDPKGLDSSVHGILQKHNVPPLMGSHRNSVDAVKMSFHTFHGDLHEQKEVDDEGGMAMGELKSIIANANDIIEWDGAAWSVVFSSNDITYATYITNSYTGTQYKWNESSWSKSYEGIYEAKLWRLII